MPPKAPEPETRKAEKDSERSAIDALPAEYAVYEGQGVWPSVECTLVHFPSREFAEAAGPVGLCPVHRAAVSLGVLTVSGAEPQSRAAALWQGCKLRCHSLPRTVSSDLAAMTMGVSGAVIIVQ